MKYLKTFESFSLILEAELKHSEVLASKLEELFKKSSQELDGLGNFDGETGEKINKAKYVEKFFESLKVEVSDIIFPKFKIQLGAIILQKCSETNFVLKQVFDDLKESITQKKLTEGFVEYLKKCLVQLNFRPYYVEPTKETGIKFGSLSSSIRAQDAFINKNVMFTSSLKLNLVNYDGIRTEIKGTIRHELQHLGQITNTLCLNVGEFFIKNIDKIDNIKVFDEISKIYEQSVKNTKVGIAKTVTGLNQNAESNMFDPETGKETSLKIALQKVIKKDPKDAGLTSEEQNLAQKLEYLGDDSEYKPWMSDKADYWYKVFKGTSSDKTVKTDDSYELTGKGNLKKRLEYFRKHGTSKKITSGVSIDNYVGLIVDLALKNDKELSLLNKLRKETSGEFYKYIRKKLESA